MNRGKPLGVTGSGSWGKMVGCVSLLFLIIGLLLPAEAAAETDKDKLAYMEFALSHPNLPPNTSVLITQLQKYGYKLKVMKENRIYFKSKRSVVSVELDNKGVVDRGLVSYGPHAELKNYAVALSIVYATLELNKSKPEFNSKEVGSKVPPLIPKLIEKAESALKGSSKSKFRFEDMDVIAERDNKTGFIYIVLQ